MSDGGCRGSCWGLRTFSCDDFIHSIFFYQNKILLRKRLTSVLGLDRYNCWLIFWCALTDEVSTSTVSFTFLTSIAGWFENCSALKAPQLHSTCPLGGAAGPQNNHVYVHVFTQQLSPYETLLCSRGLTPSSSHRFLPQRCAVRSSHQKKNQL